MNENDIDQLLDDLLQQEVPKPDAEGKQNAINLSKAEFIQQNHQAFENSARPIDSGGNFFLRTIKSIGSAFMNLSTNKIINTAFGTAAVAFVAVSALTFLPPLQQDKQDNINEVYVNESGSVINSAIVDNVDPDVSDSALEEIIVVDVGIAESEQGQATKSLVQGPRGTSGAMSPSPKADVAAPTAYDKLTKETSSSSLSSKPQLRSRVTDLGKKKASEKRRILNSILPMTAPPARTEPSAINQQRLDHGEEYAEYQASVIKQVADEPVSTFSIDVDTASYSLVRDQLNNGLLPKPQAVRAEELVNYFNYDYPAPRSKTQPFEPSLNLFDSPWNEGKKLLHIGIKGYDISADQQPDSNIVFLLDVSGSMNSQNKLPLVKQSIALLLETLKPSDTVSIAVYAGAAGTVLEPTKVKEKQTIMNALNNLNAGGSTAGGAGIRLAYQLAEQNFDKQAVNRIILATDGDFNVGQQSNEDLKTLVERKRDSGVFLSVLGFGRNNYQDDMMQALAQNGNGVAAYIDTLSEAKKVLVDEATSTLFPIAKDVKIQVEFNPSTVSDYRLVGYETRKLNREDFNNDKVDAGDIGAGHTVTVIYEITPSDSKKPSIDDARYSVNKAKPESKQSNEYGFLKIRYKLPTETKSKLIETVISKNQTGDNSEAEFSVAVAGFAQLLAGSNHTGELDYDKVITLASKHKGDDPFGYRSEFIQLVRMAKIARP